ncbi:MAG: TonB-dependent receptor [Holophagaceae bacterium]|nr:TonB-dependent receptor [Holophagaceae bacterium]
MLHLSTFSRVAALLTVGSGILIAQGVQTGNIEGRVTSANGTPLAGAAVRLETGQGVRTTVTDAQGRYRMPLLIVGPCTMSVSASGYIAQRANTRIALGQTNVVNFSMREIGVASEIVEISGAAATIDPTTVTSGKNTTAASFNALPINNRGVASIASISPGMFNESIRGAQTNHTQWLIDGVDVIDPVTGGGIMYLNEETIQEVQVVTGGATADMGRFTGGMVNVVTKSGTNQFQGTARFEISNPDWQAMAPLAAKANNAHSTLQLYHVSGPIWKDHLFFSAGYRIATPIVMNVNYTGAPAEYGGGQQYYSYSTDERYDFKLDWQLSMNHRFFGLYNNTTRDSYNLNYNGTRGTSLATLSNQPNEYGQLSFGYVGMLASNFVLKANYGSKHEILGGPGGGGVGGKDVHRMIDLGTGYIFDNGLFGEDPDDRPVDNATVSGNWFLDSPFGSHDLKFGFDWFQSASIADNAQCPSDHFVYFNGFINPVATHGTGLENRNFEGGYILHWDKFVGAKATNTVLSYYINDKVKFNEKFSANIGLRIDDFDSKNDLKSRNFGITAFSPRITGIYDVYGDGKWVFEAGYNEYAGQIMQGATDNASIVANPATYEYDYVSGPGNLRSSYSNIPFAVYNPELYRHSNLIDPDMKPPTMTEVSASIRFSDGKAGYYSLSFSNRKWKNFVATWRSPQPNPVDEDDLLLSRIANDDALTRDYNGLEFQWEKQFNREFSFGGNITLSETKGNFEGGQTGSSGPLRNWGPYGEYPAELNNGIHQPTEQQIAPYGYLSSDRPIVIRTWANYQKQVFGNGNLNLGMYAEYISGAPYSHSASAAMGNSAGGYFADRLYGSSYTRYFSDRGAFRFNSQYNASLQVGYDHVLYKRVKIFGHANITNIFNHQMLISWNTAGTSVYNAGGGVYQTDTLNRPDARFLPGDSYGKPTSSNNYLGARNVRLVMGLKF